MTASSILIVLIAVFFLIKMFTGNPLEGKWAYEDSDLVLDVKGTGSAVVRWPEGFENEDVAVSVQCTIDKEEKIVTFHADETALAEAAESTDGAVTTESLDQALESLEGSYDYNIEQGQLTLTEREYGEQMLFIKKQ